MAHLNPNMTESRHKHGKTNKTQRLLRRHVEMTRVREQASAQKNELQMEYEWLDDDLNDVRRSQQEFMNALRGEIQRSTETGDRKHLLEVWERVKSDAFTFSERLARVRQLQHLLAEPQAELIVAEEEFVRAASRLVTARSKATSLAASRQHENAENDHIHAETSPMDTIQTRGLPVDEDLPMTVQPVLSSGYSEADFYASWQHEERPREAVTALSRLQDRRTELRFYRDRLIELDWDHDEEKLSRGILLDRGDSPPIPEAEFEETYRSLRDDIEKDIEAAQKDIARFKEECRAEGTDSSTSIRRNTPSPLNHITEAEEDIRHGIEGNEEQPVPSSPLVASNLGEDYTLRQHISSESLRRPRKDRHDEGRTQGWLQSL